MITIFIVMCLTMAITSSWLDLLATPSSTSSMIARPAATLQRCDEGMVKYFLNSGYTSLGSDTQFLYCRDTAGPPLRGGVVGTYQEDGFCPGRLPGKGSTAVDRTTAPPWEGRKVGLPPPGGGSQGGGGCEGQEISPPDTEYGRAIHCDTTDSGALQGGRAAAGDTGTTAMVGAIGHILEAGEGKGGKGGSGSGTGGSNRGGDGDTRIRNGSGFRASPHEGVDHGQHRGGGVPGGQWVQWDRMERGG